jgi:hypothetical protein
VRRDLPCGDMKTIGFGGASAARLTERGRLRRNLVTRDEPVVVGDAPSLFSGAMVGGVVVYRFPWAGVGWGTVERGWNRCVE